MSAVHYCDGCGTQVDAPVALGYVVLREYCADCAMKARQFMEAEEALRKDMHEKFVDDRALLIANIGAGTFKLPDVPDA